MQTHERNLLQRLADHLWSGDRQMRKAFPADALSRVEQAVAAAERGHGGELRVVIEGGLGWDASRASSPASTLSRARAVALFAQLGVWDTAENSGVLIYILMAEHRLEIVADRGVHAKVGEQVWQDIVADTTACFKTGEYEQGLLAAIASIGDLLRSHFPGSPGDSNELADRPLSL